MPKQPPEADVRTFVRDAVDKEHRHASFDIYLFSDEYRWKKGSWTEMEGGEKLTLTEQMQQNLNSSTRIICIGASSEDIEAGLSEEDGRKVEEDRAARRADTIAKWIRSVLTKHIDIWKLNIGHHAPEYKATSRVVDTSDQRRVIIVLVLKEQEGVDIDEALHNAFEQGKTTHPIYEKMLVRYSLTRGPRFAWVN